MKKTSGRGNILLVFGILLFVSLLFVGCCRAIGPNGPDPEVSRLQQELDEQKNELQSLARLCGVPEQKTKSLSSLGLISEVKIVLGNSTGYYGETLSDKDMDFLKKFLVEDPKIEKIIRNYDAFVKRNKGRHIVVLP